jgi:hypothetical protein
MSEVKLNETKKNYLERMVPVLIAEGKTPEEAVAICSSMFSKGSIIEVEVEKSINFSGKYSDGVFTTESGKITLSDIMSAFGCDPNMEYEFEFCVEQEND